MNGDPEVALDIAEMFALSKLNRVGIATMRVVMVMMVSPLVVSHGGANRLEMGGGGT